ncbi:Cullin repeat-like-containing domain [Phaffia rhodozyma]|uniref:Cullin repeat-like-containing domain n=1 Tax=Phaffia rhodozyma TaxID=264483 RepID=A0A0F7SW39_PHARH|nr:Cullin repeat-like-containing domain [Phaffia rhodozyma]
MSNTPSFAMSSETDKSSRDSAPSPKAPYLDQWNYVERTLDDVLHERPINTKDYINSYTAIHNMCTISTAVLFVDGRPIPMYIKLHQDLQKFFDNHLETIVKPVFSTCAGTDMIRTYLEQRTAFIKITSYILRLFRFLDRCCGPTRLPSDLNGLDLNQIIHTKWKQLIFDPLMSTEGGLNDALQQEIERAVDRSDVQAQSMMKDVVNSLFALTFDIVEPILNRPCTEIDEAVDRHVKESSLDQEGPVAWPWTSDSSSLTVLAVYLNKVLASPPPLSSVVLGSKDLKDCEDNVHQTVMDRKY